MSRSIKICLLVLAITWLGATVYHMYLGSTVVRPLDNIVAFLWITAVVYGILTLRNWSRVAMAKVETKVQSIQDIGNKRYERLPELGKARVDEQGAKGLFWLKTAGWTAATAASFVVAMPVGVIIGLRGLKGVKDAWNERDEAVKSADQRRAA